MHTNPPSFRCPSYPARLDRGIGMVRVTFLWRMVSIMVDHAQSMLLPRPPVAMDVEFATRILLTQPFCKSVMHVRRQVADLLMYSQSRAACRVGLGPHPARHPAVDCAEKTDPAWFAGCACRTPSSPVEEEQRLGVPNSIFPKGSIPRMRLAAGPVSQGCGVDVISLVHS
eukprot:ANDGO_01269.mRNA.1 hypothetical protein